MKQLIGILLTVSMIFSCAKTSKKNDVVKENIGGIRDEHGCLPGAGETWSKLKKTCIQVFLAGTRFNPVEVKMGEATYSAFVVVDVDNSEVVELFIPDTPESILLHTKGNNVYENGMYSYNKRNETISYHQSIKYQKEK